MKILPGAPTNAAVVHNTTTEVVLTWDPSPSLVSDVESYTVFFKPIADTSYPLTPYVTITDVLPNYSQIITLSTPALYDFIIFANAYIGIISPEQCVSCHVDNTNICGNGVVDTTEDCEGTDIGGGLCADVGHNVGEVTCSAICEFDYSSCSTSGGGGGPVDEDNIPPNPGTASSPAYASTSPFTVTYSGVYDTGGSGLNYVALIAKRGTGSWINTGLTSSSDSGSFDFVPDPEYTNATYYFGLQAFDNDGNQSNTPSGTGDTSTIYDTQPPNIGTITVPESSNGPPITITYKDATDTGIAGLSHVELWYRQGEDGEWINSGLTNTNPSGSIDFAFDPLAESDYYYFDLIAVDNAGNKSTEDSEYQTPTVYDIDPPILESVTAEVAQQAPISIDYTGAEDVGPAGLKHMELWYKYGEEDIWTNSTLTRSATDGNFNFTPSAGSGIYYFAIVLEDNLGNRSESPAGEGDTSIIYVTEPIVAVLSNLPTSITDLDSANITVGGDDITAYKYKLDSGVYSTEIPVATEISLSSLPEGTHTLSVIGKSSLGLWQEVLSATTYSWEVDYEYVCDCDGQVANFTFRYLGANSANVEIFQKKNDPPVYSGTHNFGDEFTVNGQSNQGTLGSKITVEVNGLEHVNIHTSCSEPIEIGMQFGDFLIVDGDSRNNGRLCECEGDSCEVAEEVADEGEADEDEEVALEEILHCENQIQDEDELGVDCGGGDCPACLTIPISVIAKPMGRIPIPGVFDSVGFLNLYSSSSGLKIGSSNISIGDDGHGQSQFTDISPNTYDIGIKSNGYLNKLLTGVVLEESIITKTLDFTLDDTSFLSGGDVFSDNIVNAFDFALMIKNYLKIDATLDMNRDGSANAADLAMILRNYQIEGDSPY